jgi:hypothetical protein
LTQPCGSPTERLVTEKTPSTKRIGRYFARIKAMPGTG